MWLSMSYSTIRPVTRRPVCWTLRRTPSLPAELVGIATVLKCTARYEDEMD